MPHQWRVKLYQLEVDVWNDKGTGFVTCYHNSRTSEPSLVVKREEDESILLKSTILVKDAYERQGESIIMWRERNSETNKDVDYALSFQETGGCYAIWEAILDVQDPRYTLIQPSNDQDQYDLQYSLSPEPSQESASLYLGLPAVSVENLNDIKLKITSCFNNSQREVYASLILDYDGQYLRTLLNLSQESANSGQFAICGRIAEIVKGIIFLNSSAIVEFVLEDDIYPLVAAAMEFDPSLRTRPSYREIVSQSPNGPQCVLGLNFGNSDVLPLVKVLYRIKLLRDVMIRPLLDDTGAAAMNNLLISFQTSVCVDIFGDSNYLNRLFEEINSVQFLEERSSSEGIHPLSSPLNLSRGTTDSTILDFPRSQSESSLNKENFEQDLENEEDDNDSLACLPLTEDQRHRKLLRIRDCLGLLRELFFMSKQTLSIESRIDLYSKSLQPMRKLFFLSLKQILCLRTISISRTVADHSFDPMEHVSYSVLVNPENQSIISSMRVMASEILSTCTVVCPYLLQMSILEGSVPLPPVTTQQQPPTSSSVATSNLAFSNDPLDDMLVEKQRLGESPLSSVEPSPQKQHQSPARLSYPRYRALESQSKSFLFVLIERILCDDEVVVIEHLGDTLKVLLDPDRIEKCDREKFISLFYDYYLSWILLPFTLPNHEPDEPLDILSTLSSEDGSNNGPSLLRPQGPSAMYTSRRLIYDIVSFCVMNHTYRMKSCIVRSNLLTKFFRILVPPQLSSPSPHESSRSPTSRSPRYYHMYSLKLMKCVVSLKDDSLNRYIVKQNLFKPIFEFFSTLYSKDNILTSILVDLLEFIRKERIRILIFYIVEKLKSYYSCCLSSSCSNHTSTEFSREPCQSYYTELFETFEVTYSQLKEYELDVERLERFDSSQGVGGGGGGNSRNKRDRSGRAYGDADLEDAYFEDDEEDDQLSFENGQNGLKFVDDEEYGPSPDNNNREGGGGGGYFEDLPSYLIRPSSSERKTPPTNGGSSSTAPMSSSLSMISDLYDDFEDEQPSVVESGTKAATSDHGLDSLPPLRPKYETDEDDDEYTHAFFRSHSPHQSSSKGTKHGMSSNGSSHGGRSGGNGSPGASSSGSGISFSITNKKQRFF